MKKRVDEVWLVLKTADTDDGRHDSLHVRSEHASMEDAADSVFESVSTGELMNSFGLARWTGDGFILYGLPECVPITWQELRGQLPECVYLSLRSVLKHWMDEQRWTLPDVSRN